MADNKFGLLDGLFSTKPSAAESHEDNTKKELTTQRTWKIKNSLWDDFVVLAAAQHLTQAELINRLIENAISDGMELIERYREFFGNR